MTFLPKLRELFEAVVDLSSEQRRAYLERYCPDPAKRHEVEELVAASTGPPPGTPAPPTIHPDDIPASLRNHEKYRIFRELGRGGMGVVYQAEHKIMGRLVAVKVINHALLANPIRAFPTWNRFPVCAPRKKSA